MYLFSKVISLSLIIRDRHDGAVLVDHCSLNLLDIPARETITIADNFLSGEGLENLREIPISSINICRAHCIQLHFCEESVQLLGDNHKALRFTLLVPLCLLSLGQLETFLPVDWKYMLTPIAEEVESLQTICFFIT